MYVMIQRMRTPERPEREHQAMPAPAHGYAPARSPGWAAAWGDHPPAALFPIVRHVQPHLAVSQPGDPAELEAERVAEQVTRQVDPSAAQPALSVVQRCPGSPTGPSGECLACGHTPALVPRAATEVGQGQPLPAGVRRFFEPRFGADFGAVRVHADPAAAQAARSIGALAYTVGPDIVFGSGQYAPQTGAGQRLLAHELAHVVQQGHGPASVQRQTPGGGAGGGTPTSFTFNVTPQIQWAIEALMIRPVREEETWACLAGVGEYDRPRILLNYLIQYQGNRAFAQIIAQQPAGVDRETYLMSVAQFLWDSIRASFLQMIADRLARSASFRARVERVRAGEGCARVPFERRGGMVAV